MTLHIYNSLKNEKEKFEPIDQNVVKMYVCGQTVYDYMHIGHARTYVAFDIVRRYLEYMGYSVETIINLTDVNDKINNRARNEERSPWEVAEEFSTINLEDFESLGIRADIYPKASEYIAEMIDLVKSLEENGLAYEVEGDVFFDASKFDDYGKLSNQELEDMRQDRDDIKSKEKKKNPQDFVLWKSREGSDYTPTWDSPWGEGIPGWHIECSAMSMNLLGEQIDIHGGGSDLVFPHHENEIAQVEGVTDKQWVKYWMHSGLVNIQEEKMSKSLGNIVSAREILNQYDPKAVRLMVAGSHYREPMSYSKDKIEEAEKNLNSLRDTLENLQAEIRNSDTIPEKFSKNDKKKLEKIFELKKMFLKAMNDDFNTPKALKSIYKLEKLINSYISQSPKRPVLERSKNTLLELSSIIGILREKNRESLEESKIEDIILKLVDLREQLRKNGNYDTADSIRDALKDADIKIEDTNDGPRIKGL